MKILVKIFLPLIPKLCQQKSSQDYSQTQEIHARWQINQLWQILLLWISKTGAGLLLCVIHFGFTDFCWDSVPAFTCTEKPHEVKWETNCKLTLIIYFLSWEFCLSVGQILKDLHHISWKAEKLAFFPGNVLLAYSLLRQINWCTIFSCLWNRRQKEID